MCCRLLYLGSVVARGSTAAMGPQPYVLTMILRPVSLVSPLDHHWTVSLRVKVAFCSRRGPQSWDKNPRGLQNSTYLVRKSLLFKAAWRVFIEECFRDPWQFPLPELDAVPAFWLEEYVQIRVSLLEELGSQSGSMQQVPDTWALAVQRLSDSTWPAAGLDLQKVGDLIHGSSPFSLS